MVSACVVSLSRSNSERRQNARVVQRRRYLGVAARYLDLDPRRRRDRVDFERDTDRRGTILPAGWQGSNGRCVLHSPTSRDDSSVRRIAGPSTRAARQLLQPEQLAPPASGAIDAVGRTRSRATLETPYGGLRRPTS